jgi:hypothetical protein
MAIDVHTIATGTGSGFLRTDRVMTWFFPATANTIGGGAGSAVTVAITGDFPSKYAVFVDGFSQDATAYVTAKTSAGFTVNLLPRLAANTLAVGTFDVLVIA